MVATKAIIWALISASFGSFSSLAIADEFLFSPKGSQFSVEFPSKPVIRQSYSAEHDNCVTFDAILSLLDGKAGLRAESTVCSNTNAIASNLDEQDILDELRQHAKRSGVTDTLFQVEKTEFGYVGTCRGALASLGNTFTCVLMLGDESAIMLVGSAPYNDYPTIGFDKFIESVHQVDQATR